MLIVLSPVLKVMTQEYMAQAKKNVSDERGVTDIPEHFKSLSWKPYNV